MSGYKPNEVVEYFSRSQGGYIKTRISVVHPNGFVEVACKPGAQLDPNSDAVRQPRDGSLADNPVHQSKHQVGHQVEYYSQSMRKWVDAVVQEVRADGAIMINCKPGAWIAGGAAASSIRAKASGQVGTDAIAPSNEGNAPPDSWELIEKKGFLSGPMDDKVGSVDIAKQTCMSKPDEFMGFSVSQGPSPMVFIRKQGSTLVAIDTFTTYMLSCKPINYQGKLFEDVYCTNAQKFTGGLENGKGGTPHVTWKRPGRGEGMLDRPGVKLFGSIDPNDLHQGAVGDCSLIASIACLCEFPDRLQRLFSRTTLSQSGRYDVTLWDWGKKDWITRAIDDRFATKNADAPEPMFVKATEDLEIYPMLIEKAVAIMAGGFDFMSSIMPPWALAVLTGNPDVWHFTANNGQWTGTRPVYDGTSTYQSVQNISEGAWPDGGSGNQPKRNAEMWEIMRSWDEQQFMIVVGSAAQGKSDSSSLPCGIIYMHAYSVLQVKTNICGTGINLCQVRNPHGAGGQEPNLSWKDHDTKWQQYPQIAQECGINTTGFDEDGLFWIQDTDFFGPSSNHYNTIYMVKEQMTKRHAHKR